MSEEEDNYEDNMQAPYIYSVSATLKQMMSNNCVMKGRWADKIGDDEWAMGKFNADVLNVEITKGMEKEGFDETIIRITASVKSAHRKATKQAISLDDFSSDEWNKRVEPVLRQEWRPRYGSVS